MGAQNRPVLGYSAVGSRQIAKVKEPNLIRLTQRRTFASPRREYNPNPHSRRDPLVDRNLRIAKIRSLATLQRMAAAIRHRCRTAHATGQTQIFDQLGRSD
jgi:hypothetical protein